uniref:hypothetical protein n=1 Tax=Ningiella ruwaisensis TaxID=2364274 RepID=UPI00109F36BE|nr:hypothetical protein [Ningiella ruwaisensis]
MSTYKLPSGLMSVEKIDGGFSCDFPKSNGKRNDALIEAMKELWKANKRIAELERELKQKELFFVGYTNPNQIEYAKEDEGTFYSNTDNNCYIPLFMLNVHKHRLEY